MKKLLLFLLLLPAVCFGQYGVYNKTPLRLDSLLIGNTTAFVRINADGIFMIDSATQWTDLVIPSTLINPTGLPAPPVLDNTDGTLLFENAKLETITAIFQMPHGYKSGTDVSFHIHVCKTSAATGTALFRTKYRWVNIGDTATSFTVLDTMTIAPETPDGNLNGQHIIYESDDFNGVGKGFSSIIIVYLEREAQVGTGDNYEASMKLLSLDVHYQVENFGSRREYSK